MAEIFEQLNVLQKLNSAVLEIGVFVTETGRRESVQVGLTNAELMFIHENGSPLRNIPARPVLDMTLQYARDTAIPELFEKCLDGCLQQNWDEKKIDRELDRFAIRLQSYARHIIYDNDGRLAPNTPNVAARKGGNHPLFDTGQLARSLTCKIIKS